jgi:hypothetical protein
MSRRAADEEEPALSVRVLRAGRVRRSRPGGR